MSIYRDGFRVYPYGQKGNDWLNLDIRSRLNPVRNMANNQIVAAIKISRAENPELRDRSTREGMVVNAEHAALEDCFKNILSLLEERRYDIRPRRREEDPCGTSVRGIRLKPNGPASTKGTRQRTPHCFFNL